VQQLDAVASIPDIQRVGEACAEQVVSLQHLKGLVP
jgi:hypothetical protein